MSRAASFLAFLLIAFSAATVRAGSVRGYVFLMPVTTEFKSVGFAEYLNDLNQRESAVLSGTHRVTGPQTFETVVAGDGSYSNDLQGPAVIGACYGTTLQVTADPPGLFHTTQGSWTGETRCATASGNKGDPFNNACETNTCPPQSPIVINIARGRYRFSSAQQGVMFDIDADGDLERVAWPLDVGEVGFLFLDRNGNGVPDDASELFGDHTPLQNGQIAEHGFDALTDLDANRDGVLSPSDSAWSRLALWLDRDRNGVGNAGEIASLASVAIKELALGPNWIGHRDRYGNALRLQSHVALSSGAAHPYYDVYLTNIQ